MRFVTKMRKIVAFIPHLFTLGNLFCGCLGIIFAFNWRLDWAAYMVFLAAFLDFFDGFFARLLKVEGDLGKQLDSLADMVSFGVVPGIVVYQLLVSLFQENINAFASPITPGWHVTIYSGIEYVKYVSLLIPVFSCYRLAKFNIDTRQTNGFIGLPTPANAIFFVSIALIVSTIVKENLLPYNSSDAWNYYYNLPLPNSYTQINDNSIESHISSFKTNFFMIVYNVYTLVGLTVIFSFLLVSPLPLFALKFKNFGWADNKIRYIFLGISAGLLICFQLIAIPFIIVLYILISIVNNIFKITV